MDLIITILPVVTKDLPISPRFTPYNFLSRCKFSTLTTRQPIVEFYLLTFPRFPLRKKEHKSYLGKNRTHDFRTSRYAAYLLDHSTTYKLKNMGSCPLLLLLKWLYRGLRTVSYTTQCRYLLSIGYFHYVARGTVRCGKFGVQKHIENSHRFRHVFTRTKGA